LYNIFRTAYFVPLYIHKFTNPREKENSYQRTWKKDAIVSMTSKPQGGRFFDSMKRNFVDVPIDKENGNAIATSEFLEATESLTKMFGLWPLSRGSFGSCAEKLCTSKKTSH
jgi:hypothetical protein